MSPAEQAGLFTTLFAMGVTGSLHCVAMCGPILLGFARALGSAGDSKLDFVAYHAGRIWTYGILGLAIGFLGSSLRDASASLGLQRPLSILMSIVIVVSGLAALGLIPGWRLSLGTPVSCSAFAEESPIAAWLRQPGKTARLLLGAIMGFLPCGLVYAALLLAAALPTPAHSAVGMLCFGVGTVPALTLVLLGGRGAFRWLPRGGARVAAIVLITVGCLMLARTLLVTTGGTHGL